MVFTSILEHGLTSKNSRTRAESAAELGGLFARHGVSHFSLPRSLPAIAKLISDRDTAVRTAALVTIGAVYTHAGGDVVWKNVGPLADKEKSMLEERLKRTEPKSTSTSTSALPSRSTTPVVRPPPIPRAQQPHHEELAPAPPRASSLPARKSLVPPRAASSVAAPPSSSLEGIRRPALPVPRAIARPTSTASSPRPSSSASMLSASGRGGGEEIIEGERTPAQLRRLIQAIRTDDLAQSAERLKKLQTELESQPGALLPEADNFVEVIAAQMAVAFVRLDRDTPQVALRLCKHLMQTLSTFFDNKMLGQKVSPEMLALLLAELTGRLLDTAENPDTEAISSLSKVLNMVLIRIFHHADQTACFTYVLAPFCFDEGQEKLTSLGLEQRAVHCVE